jgi:hypothetical protein
VKKAKKTKGESEKLTEIIEIARRNLVNFRKTVLVTSEDEVLPAPFHFDWSHYLLESKKNIAIEAFRESAKTQYVLRAFPHYALMFPDTSRDYIVLIKQNTTLAQNKLKEIEQEYESNPALQANCKKIIEKSGQVLNVDIKQPNGKKINVRIEAYGKGSSIRGLANLDRRPKIVICDDLQDTEDSRSDTVMESDWKWFLSDVHFLGQNSRIFMIGNNLGEKCILEQVERFKDEIGFDFVRLPICNADGVPHWPSKYKAEEIQLEKEAFNRMGRIDVWLRERMCIAVGEETRCFNEEDYRYFHMPTDRHKPHDKNRYATLDPASSKNPESCLRSIIVNEVDVDNNWFLQDCRYGRWDSKELIDQMFEVVDMWGIKDFGIEKGQYKDIIEPFLFEEMKKRNVFFDVIPLEHGKIGSKLERIKMLQPRFKAHSIYFPQDAAWLPELKTELAGVTKDAIKSLYIDCVDALAMQTQIAKRPYRTVGERQIGKTLPRTCLQGDVFADA